MLTSGKKQPSARWFEFLILMVLGWQLCVIGVYATDDAFFARLLFDWKIPFVSFSAMALLALSLNFYMKGDLLTRPVMMIICVIPVITTFFAITSPLHVFLRAELIMDTTGELNTAVNVRGPWFWVHSAYGYVMMVAALLIGFINHRRLNKSRRRASVIFLAGIIATIAPNFIELTKIIDYPLDFTLIGMSVSLIMLYAALSAVDEDDFLYIARTRIFNYMEEIAVVADKDRNIVDLNDAAKKWAKARNVNENGNLNDILEHFRQAGAEILTGVDGMDIRISNQEQLILNVTENPIVDGAGKKRGSVFILRDVTDNRLLIEKLQKNAGEDVLTGLANRFSFELDKERFDKSENLPLAIIFGDLDGLKAVNDTYGHSQGDEYLKAITDVLNKCRPQNAALYRVGGDEFIMLAPACPPVKAREIINCIMEMADGIVGYAFPVSIALGYAVKTRMGQNLTAIVEAADRKMYEYKRGRREEED